jgi:hypothetical protein
MSHQDGLGDNGPETTGLSKPDDGDDRMEKKSENVAHARDGIKLKNLKNSGRLRNSPTTSFWTVRGKVHRLTAAILS